jgi:hypothetical protein
MADEPRRYYAVGVGSGLTSRFTVSGGPFSRPQEMGWHITNERGFTRAVSCDHAFAERLNDVEALIEILRKRNALYLLRRVADEGYTEFSDEEQELLSKMLGTER